MTRGQIAWLLLPACLAGGLLALHFGFALEWDLLNYHLYNPHALLTGRSAIDVAPAQLQTFLNPGLHLPLYLLFRQFGPGTAVFVTGAVQAGQVVLLYLLAEEVAGGRVRQRYLLLSAALLGLGGPIFLNQLGSGQGDTLLSIFVLAALLLVVREFRRPGGEKTLAAGFAAGLLLGVAGALKLTLMLYALALALAAFACFGGRRRWTLTAGMAGGGLAGVLLAGGPWFLHQYLAYGNPFLPYFNNLFASEWVDAASYRDLRFLPHGAAEWLFYPWFWFDDPRQVWEYDFRDLRLPLLLLCVFVLPLVGWRAMRRSVPALGLVWLFTAVSYLLWLGLFSIYRYLSVLELLAPLVLFCSVAVFTRHRLALLATAALLVGTQFGVIHHRNPATWELRADTPTELADLPRDAMVIAGGYRPTGYAALWLPAEVPLVRFRSNFMTADEPRHRMHRLAYDRIRGHGGPFYLLLEEAEISDPVYARDLERLGLAAIDPAGCRGVFRSATLQSRLGLSLCRLQRAAPGAQSSGR